MSKNKFENSNIKKEYQSTVKEWQPKSNHLRNIIFAFLIGGLICTIGECFSKFGESVLELDQDKCSCFTSSVMIFLGALLTGIGVYDDIGKIAGAGSLVPITGYANSIVAPAMEHKREGLVFGVAAKMFSLAGPVLVYGISLSVVVGIIYFIFTGGQ